MFMSNLVGYVNIQKFYNLMWETRKKTRLEI
jgi:hypothetical protein